MDDKVFWMVYVEGGTGPIYKHSVEAAAKIEAVRMAKKTGSAAYVLKAVAKCEPAEVVWSGPAPQTRRGYQGKPVACYV